MLRSLRAWFRNIGRRPVPIGPRHYRPEWELLEDRTLLNGGGLILTAIAEAAPPNDTPALAQQVVVNVEIAGAINAIDDVDFYQVTLPSAGRITARLQGNGVASRVSLFAQAGANTELLIQSEDTFAQHLDTQPYFLRVEGLGGGSGSYTLAVEFVPASPPFQLVPVGGNVGANAPFVTEYGPRFAVADLNDDDCLDLVVAHRRFDLFGEPIAGDVSILLGRNDGTFHALPVRPAVGVNPANLVIGNFNNDAFLDVATADRGDSNRGIPDSISILHGNGDGTFQPAVQFQAGATALAAGHFTADDRLDLAIVDSSNNDVRILVQQPDGSFQASGFLGQFGVGSNPMALAVGHFDNDTFLDVATANAGTPSTGASVSVLRGNGDGTLQGPFGPGPAVGHAPFAIVVGDFNGDTRLDVATANSHFEFGTGFETADGDVSVLFGNGNGTVGNELRLTAGSSPYAIAADDFDGDGVTDLATANHVSADVSIFVHDDAGSLREQLRFGAGAHPFGIVAGDFDHDDRADLATANDGSGESVAVLRGRGDGTFQGLVATLVGGGPAATVTSDFNGDGLPDVATANRNSNDVSVLLGQGDGTFQEQDRVAVGGGPVALAEGDFNADGRRDLAVVNRTTNNVTVLLGLGNGRFREVPGGIAVGLRPRAIVAADFDGDDVLDLAIANSGFDERRPPQDGPGTISIRFGRGDGTFRDGGAVAVGGAGQPFTPIALAAADFDDDGFLDLATLSSGLSSSGGQFPSEAAILRGGPGGTFTAQAPFGAVADPPTALVAGQFSDDNGDNRIDDADNADLVVAGGFFGLPGEVVTFLGDGSGAFGSFGPNGRFPVGNRPAALAIVRLNDDNGDKVIDNLDRPYLVTADFSSSAVTLLRAELDGSLTSVATPAVGDGPATVAIADFNRDDLPDVVVANDPSSSVSVQLGRGGLAFTPPSAAVGVPRATPLLADLDDDLQADVVVLRGDGRLLFRAGRPGEPGAFAPPMLVNPDPLAPVRDAGLLRAGGRVRLVVLEARGLAFYDLVNGTYTRTAGPAVPGESPTRLTPGDINGDGLDDLAVASAGSRRVFVYLQDLAGGFGPPAFQAPVGVNPSDIRLARIDADVIPDLVVSNRFSGDVSVLLNNPAAPFAEELRFRAGRGPYELSGLAGAAAAQSREGSAALVAGRFLTGAPVDQLVVPDSDANRFAFLRASAVGGLLEPTNVATGSGPLAAATGDFNGDGNLDVAILGRLAVEVFRGDGTGGFLRTFTRDAGNSPRGLTAIDVNGDGILDLLIGNELGDVLTLLGNRNVATGLGDGTFRDFERLDRNIALAVADLDGDGRDDFVFANESLDRVAVQYSQPGTDFTQDRRSGLLAPGAVDLTDLNRDGLPDLVVSNRGGNSVFVYQGTANGEFGLRQEFAVGRAPVGLTVADLNGDQVPEIVVANEESNAVDILFGLIQGGSWTSITSQRLRADTAPVGSSPGSGPVATAIRDDNGDGIPEALLVVNSQSNDVHVLPSVGQGLFDDRAGSVTVLPTGAGPTRVFTGQFDVNPGLDLISLDALANSLTFFSNFGAGQRIFAGGLAPRAGLAGDFNGDGFTDLVVAGNGDGRVGLLFGGGAGPALAQVQTVPGLLHPTAVALAAVTGTGIEVYLADEGEEAVARLTFDIQFGLAVVGPGSVPLGETTTTTVVDLPGLTESSLAFVATLFSIVGGDATVDAPTTLDGETEAAPGAIVFGLDDSFLADPNGPANGGGEGAPVPFERVLTIVRQTVSEWIGEVSVRAYATWLVLEGTSRAVLEEVAQALESALEPLGWTRVQLPRLQVEDLLLAAVDRFEDVAADHEAPRFVDHMDPAIAAGTVATVAKPAGAVSAEEPSTSWTWGRFWLAALAGLLLPPVWWAVRRKPRSTEY